MKKRARRNRYQLRAVRRVYVRESGAVVEPGEAFEARLTKQEFERLLAMGAAAIENVREVRDGTDG